jgi:hypothetical protein
LVKITTSKSYQKSNDCDDLYDVTELNDDFQNKLSKGFIEDNKGNKENKSNCFDNKNKKEKNLNLNNDSLYNYFDDFDSDFYSRIISKDEKRNNDNKVFADLTSENKDREVNSPSDAGNARDSINYINVNDDDFHGSNLGFREPGENYERDKFIVRNSEISFDQLNKFRFEYDNQSKIKNGGREIKHTDEKENDLQDGIIQTHLSLVFKIFNAIL